MKPHNYLKKDIKKKKINWKLVLGILILLMFIGGSVYLAVFSPYLKIRNIFVEGAERISSSEVQTITEELLHKKIFGLIPVDGIMVFSGPKAANILLNTYAQIEDIKIIKKLPASLMVQITERQEVVHYCNHGDCFLLDKKGIAFEKTVEVYGGLRVCLRDNSDRGLKIRDKVIEPKIISFLTNVQKILFEEVNISIVNFEINAYPTAEVGAINVDGWKIIFDLTRAPDGQVLALREILDEKIKEQRDSLEYIDLRVKNKVYYKYHDSAQTDAD